MKYYYLIVVLFLNLESTAQKHDNIWLIGDRNCIGCPIPILDFTYGHPDTAGIYSPFGLDFTNASISDSSGFLQFYTNGIFVANKFGQILSGSTDFNLDSSAVHFGWNYYIPNFQCAIAVPFPGHTNQYCLFHVSGRDWTNGIRTWIQPFRLAYSIIDMSLNNGAGQMVLKNNTVLSDTLIYSSMQSVKHANGRDWWIVSHETSSNGMYAALLGPDSITAVIHSNTGPTILFGNSIGQSKFSPDGSKFALAYRDSSILYLYNFDRCTGIFIFDTLIRHTKNPNGFNIVSCAFSPNNRFLYASDYFNIYQYDLYEADIPASRKTIGTYDGSTGNFFRLSNGPDGKIYENSWGSNQFLHVINDPDQLDTACNFVADQLKVMNFASSIPDFPNYRLGELYNTPCDSLTNNMESIANRENVVFYPNPSSGIFQLNSKIESASFVISVYNILGENILSKMNEKEIDLSNAENGIYFFRLITTDGKFHVGVLLKK